MVLQWLKRMVGVQSDSIAPYEQERRENELFVQKYCMKEYNLASILCHDVEMYAQEPENAERAIKLLQGLEQGLQQVEIDLGKKRGPKAVAILKKGLPSEESDDMVTARSYNDFVSSVRRRATTNALLYNTHKKMMEYASEGKNVSPLAEQFTDEILKCSDSIVPDDNARNILKEYIVENCVRSTMLKNIDTLYNNARSAVPSDNDSFKPIADRALAWAECKSILYDMNKKGFVVNKEYQSLDDMFTQTIIEDTIALQQADIQSFNLETIKGFIEVGDIPSIREKYRTIQGLLSNVTSLTEKDREVISGYVENVLMTVQDTLLNQANGLREQSRSSSLPDIIRDRCWTVATRCAKGFLQYSQEFAKELDEDEESLRKLDTELSWRNEQQPVILIPQTGNEEGEK